MTSANPESAGQLCGLHRNHIAAIKALQAGRLEDAIALCEQAEADLASDCRFLVTYGDALRQQGRRMEALARIRRALALEPDAAPVHAAMAAILCELGALEEALKHARRARQIDPVYAHALYAEALVLVEALRISEAAEALRSLLLLAPDHRPGLSTLLYLLNLIPGLDPAEVAREHLDRVRRCYPPPVSAQVFPENHDPTLRIGFLSADLRDHPVGRFVAPLFERLDRQRFQIVAYSTGPADDELGRQLQRTADLWVDVRDFSDNDLESRLRDDRLDLLVDLSGHTLGQRMAVLSRRPARRIATWLGYPNTTGLETIDFRIVDQVLLPPCEALPGSEAIVRLPGSFACFRPNAHAPDPAAHPTGPIMFGSLHRLEKLSADVIELWGELMRRLPEARLLLARDQLDARRQIELRQQLTNAGVDPSRLELRQVRTAAESYQTIFNEIDVLLDVFPWSGHTLACEALWMGVPVVTLHGNSVAGRLTSSALAAAGCGEWIAKCGSDYVAIAEHLSSDLDLVRAGRRRLRCRIGQSPLMDESRFASDFGNAIEVMAGTRRGSSIQ